MAFLARSKGSFLTTKEPCKDPASIQKQTVIWIRSLREVRIPPRGPISIPAELLRTIWKRTSALSVIRSGTSRLSTPALRLPKKPILRVDSGGLCLLSGQEKHIEAFASLVYIAVSRANAHLDNSTCRFRKQWRVLLGARQAPIIGWVRG